MFELAHPSDVAVVYEPFVQRWGWCANILVLLKHKLFRGKGLEKGNKCQIMKSLVNTTHIHALHPRKGTDSYDTYKVLVIWLLTTFQNSKTQACTDRWMIPTPPARSCTHERSHVTVLCSHFLYCFKRPYSSFMWWVPSFKFNLIGPTNGKPHYYFYSTNKYLLGTSLQMALCQMPRLQMWACKVPAHKGEKSHEEDGQINRQLLSNVMTQISTRCSESPRLLTQALGRVSFVPRILRCSYHTHLDC